MTSHDNKIQHVTTITKVAEDLSEDEDWLCDFGISQKILAVSA